MRYYKLLLNEKREGLCYEGVHEKFVKAENRDCAYNKSLKIAATFFQRYHDAPTGIPDKDMIFWFNKNTSVWINSLEEIKMV